MNRKILNSAAICAIIAIIFGAFGAHKLKELLPIEKLTSFETGVRYQMYHVFLLLFLGLFDKIDEKQKKLIYRITMLGILFFSGSIYILSTQSIFGLDFSAIGFITPLGGMLFIASWVLLLRNFLKLESA